MITIKIFVPYYYRDFRCIADRCPDTCCAGWDVNFDPADAEYYRGIGGSIGDRLRAHLAVDEDGDNIFTLTENRRCPFLNEKNLCDLYIALGEDSLCPTCTLFPRFYDDFGTFREMGLGFGCPEAARIMLSQEKPLTLTEYGFSDDENFEIDEDTLKILLEARKCFFGILADGQHFKEQAKEILEKAKKIQLMLNGEADTENKADFEDVTGLMSEMEYIDESRKALYLSLQQNLYSRIFEEYADDFRRLAEYYIFRYVLKAVYDYDLLTKIKYGFFACAVTARAYAKKKVLTLEDRVKIMCGFSKEVEYSDVNTELLDSAMYEQFGCESLIALLS